MSYTSITPPNQGDPTRKALIDALIANDVFFYSIIGGILSFVLPNGSFELWTNNGSEDLPDNWTRTLYTGGAFVLTGDGRPDTECHHGKVAVKFTSPGGAGNGGGFLETSDYLECTPLRPFILSWLTRSTAAGVRNKVTVQWFTAARVTISTVELWSSANNPTSWQQIFAGAIPPATARYCKIKLVGCENTSTTAGSCYFDDVRVGLPEFRHVVTLDEAGNYAWTCPTGVTCVLALLLGPGGGAGGHNTGTTGDGGGGGGALCMVAATVSPGTAYTLHVGTGGSGGVAGAGTPAAGNDDPTTAFGGSAGGGLRGTGSAAGVPGNGGAGGAATGGFINISGGNGSNGVGSDGGNGGGAPEIGVGGWGQTGNGAGTPGKWGGGGGGAGGTAAAGGDGSDGVIVLFIL